MDQMDQMDQMDTSMSCTEYVLHSLTPYWYLPSSAHLRLLSCPRRRPICQLSKPPSLSDLRAPQELRPATTENGVRGLSFISTTEPPGRQSLNSMTEYRLAAQNTHGNLPIFTNTSELKSIACQTLYRLCSTYPACQNTPPAQCRHTCALTTITDWPSRFRSLAPKKACHLARVR